MFLVLCLFWIGVATLQAQLDDARNDGDMTTRAVLVGR